MARPKAKELTERELEVMHAFWQVGESTVAGVRECLADSGRDLAYTTVATLVRILMEKGFVEQTETERPFQYRPIHTFEDVSALLATRRFSAPVVAWWVTAATRHRSIVPTGRRSCRARHAGGRDATGCIAFASGWRCGSCGHD